MRTMLIIFSLAAALAAQPADAQGRGRGNGKGNGNGNPHPEQSVAGRTYCAVVTYLNMGGATNVPPPADGQVENLLQGVLRGIATFGHDGTYYRLLLSNAANFQTDIGIVCFFSKAHHRWTLPGMSARTAVSSMGQPWATHRAQAHRARISRTVN